MYLNSVQIIGFIGKDPERAYSVAEAVPYKELYDTGPEAPIPE